MGSTTSSANIDPTLLEEAAMYSSATIKECIQYYHIFSNTCRIESIPIDSDDIQTMDDVDGNPKDDIQTMGDDDINPKRIDPYNGTAYTREEFIDEYTGTVEWDAAKEVVLTADSSTSPNPPSSSSSSTSTTMRYEEFLCIPEFTYHPLAQQLFEWALHSEPYFEHETPIAVYEICRAVGGLGPKRKCTCQNQIGVLLDCREIHHQSVQFKKVFAIDRQQHVG